MHVGVVGPCSSGMLADFLPECGGVDIGWGGNSVVELVRGLLKRGHQVSVITLSPDLAERRLLKGPRLSFDVYPTRTNRKMRDVFKIERRFLRDGIALAKPDILHAHWTYEFALASLEANLPVVVTCRDNAFLMLWYRRDMYRLGRLLLQTYVLRKARFVTAVSPYLARSLQWLCKGKIEVIPNVMDIHADLMIAKDRNAEPVRIVTVLNGWQRRKNPKAAIRAFNYLRNKYKDAELFMYGVDFEEGGVASRWAKKRDLAENIHFCGARSRSALLTELSKMSILLHPAYEESFGMVILEAMNLGVPVVAGRNCGGVQWVLDGGRAGFLTDISDPEAIERTLVTCIENEEDRERRRISAMERARTVFSAEAVAEQYEALYRKVLAYNDRPGCGGWTLTNRLG